MADAARTARCRGEASRVGHGGQARRAGRRGHGRRVEDPADAWLGLGLGLGLG